MSDNLNDSKKEETLSSIQENMYRDDFATYMNYCVKKWKRLEVELKIIDSIMLSVCKQWDISKVELMEDRKLTQPRALMYYIIKKKIKLSYGEIGELFGKQKSYIHKAVDDMTFMVEQHCQKNIVIKLRCISKELSFEDMAVTPL